MREIYKKLIKYLFWKIPLPLSLWESLEKLSSICQGKGWGSSTIKNEVTICSKLLSKKPNIFIDIGANKGLYTKNILSKFPNIECHIFEPSIHNYKILTKTFKNNQKIKLNQLALGKEKKKTKLFSNEFGSGIASLTKRRLDHFKIDMKLEEEITLLRFDEYWLNKEKIIDYVKIDVEGHELDVLKGFGDTLFKTKLIQFEFGGCNIDTRTYFQDFWYFFLEKGFKVFRITPKGRIPINYYKEEHEYFLTTNYIAFNKRFTTFLN